jgi:hypothetical protein
MYTPLPGQKVQGIGGKVGEIMGGTIRWYIEDDDGVTHAIEIPNGIYLPTAPSRLLSPQHWAQEARDNKPDKDGTWCATYQDAVILWWGQRKFRRTIKIDRHGSNVATIRTAPGYKGLGYVHHYLMRVYKKNLNKMLACSAKSVYHVKSHSQKPGGQFNVCN